MALTARPTRCRDSWRIRWKDHTGKRRSQVFRTFDQAARELCKRHVERDEILAGNRLAEPEDRSFEALANWWRVHRLPEKRSAADDESMLRCHLIPAFGGLALRAIRAEQIEKYKLQRSELSAKTVGNHLTLLGSMLGAAVDLGWLNSKPTIRKPRANPDDDLEQPWLRTSEEIERLLRATQEEIEPGDPLSALPFVLYSTAIYTGMRAGELAGLAWSEVDFQRRTIHVRRSYSGRTKTRASRRHIPIVDMLLPTLRSWRLRCPTSSSNLVFPNRAGGMHDQSARVFQEVLHRALDRAGFPRPTSGKNKHVIHFHSFRHTFACHWRLRGGPMEELVKVLGHTSKAMTDHYANIGGYHRPEHFKIFGHALTAE